MREIHNLSVIDTANGLEVALHLKLPGDTALGAAHDAAEHVERAIAAAVPEVAAVQTHIEPLREESAGEVVEHDSADVERIVVEATGERAAVGSVPAHRRRSRRLSHARRRRRA